MARASQVRVRFFEAIVKKFLIKMLGFSRSKWGAGLQTVLLAGTIFVAAIDRAPAQIVPDRSLGAESSQVAPLPGSIDRVRGGATRGDTLFHSFTAFSVPAGRTALFDETAGVDRIVTRVTGGGLSQIDGTIRALGAADLFLINPSGIAFGPNARIDIGGSFVGATADSVVFGNGAIFSAIDPQAPPLLTVNVPVGLQLGENPGAIANRSRSPLVLPFPPMELPISMPERFGLQVRPGKTFALVGGDISFDGGSAIAMQGRVELLSANGPGFVGLNADPAGALLNPDGIATFGNLSLTNGAAIDTTSLGGGSVRLRGGDVRLASGASVSSNTLGDVDGGDIFVSAERLRVESGAFLSATTFGAGRGSNIILSGRESVTIVGTGAERFQENFIAGVLNDSVEPDISGTGAFQATIGTGAAGKIFVEAPQLMLENGAVLFNTTFGSGAGGDLRVRASERFEVNGSGVFVANGIDTSGRSGNIDIETSRLALTDAGTLTTIALGDGDGGNITVRAGESVSLGQTPAGSLVPTNINSISAFGNGKAGSIAIATQQLSLHDGAEITSGSGTNSFRTSTIATGGPAGNIDIYAAEKIELKGQSADGMFGSSLNATSFTDAPAGELHLTTENLIVGDRGSIAVNSVGFGDAGLLSVVAGRIRLDGGAIDATTVMGEGGNIDLQANDIRLFRGARIGTDAGNSDGGNVAIVTDILIARGNSDITANGRGRGGRVSISARAIFGAEFRESATDGNDITATSELGPQFEGTVEIDQPQVQTDRAIAAPPEVLDATVELGRDPCSQSYRGKFFWTGQGGLPANPTQETYQPVPHFGIQDLWISEDEGAIEAKGWVRDADGDVILTAAASPTGCPGLDTAGGDRFFSIAIES